MGCNHSVVIRFDSKADNIHDLKVEIKDKHLIVSYYYTSHFKHTMNALEKPTEYYRKDIIKLTKRETITKLEMDLYTFTSLNKYDCVKIAEFILTLKQFCNF